MSESCWIVAEPYDDADLKHLKTALKRLGYRRIHREVLDPVTQEVRTDVLLGPDGVLSIEQDNNMLLRLSVQGAQHLVDSVRAAFAELPR
ncbi:MAG: hypothetical protein ABUL73_04285 [Alphaproteobacteria bacterium]